MYPSGMIKTGDTIKNRYLDDTAIEKGMSIVKLTVMMNHWLRYNEELWHA